MTTPAQPRRSRNSIYYITINSNLPFKEDEESRENLRMFEEIINEIFSEDELFDYVRFTRSPIKEKEKNIALIPNIDINIAFEVQSTDAGHNKIHAHILLAFLKHNTYI